MTTKEVKIADAKIRLQNRHFRTNAEQILHLNNYGFTARKERTRLCKLVHLDFEESFDLLSVEKAIKAGM